MSKWLAITALLGATLVFTAPAQAQQQGRRGGGRGMAFSLMQLPAPIQDKLKLTDDQKAKLKEIGDGFRAAQRQARQDAQNSGATQEDTRAKLQPITQKANEDALAVLTSDQKATFDILKAEQKDFAGLGRSSVALLLVDGLTDDQKGKIKGLASDTQTKIQEAFTSAGDDRQAARQKTMDINTEATANLRKLLTDDQVKQFDAALEKIPAGRGRRGAATT